MGLRPTERLPTCAFRLPVRQMRAKSEGPPNTGIIEGSIATKCSSLKPLHGFMGVFDKKSGDVTNEHDIVSPGHVIRVFRVQGRTLAELFANVDKLLGKIEYPIYTSFFVKHPGMEGTGPWFSSKMMLFGMWSVDVRVESIYREEPLPGDPEPRFFPGGHVNQLRGTLE